VTTIGSLKKRTQVGRKGRGCGRIMERDIAEPGKIPSPKKNPRKKKGQIYGRSDFSTEKVSISGEKSKGGHVALTSEGTLRGPRPSVAGRKDVPRRKKRDEKRNEERLGK